MVSDKSDEMICDAFGELLEECKGANVIGWREETKCCKFITQFHCTPVLMQIDQMQLNKYISRNILAFDECPVGMDFSYEAPGCPNSCENQNSELTCASGTYN